MKSRLPLVLALVGLGASASLAPQIADAKPKGKVWLCHETSSATNPYVLIHVNANAWDGEGKNDHTRHEGDFEADGPDFDCNADDDTGFGDDGGGTGGDDGGGTGGDDGGGTGGDTGGGGAATCSDYATQADCDADADCTWAAFEGGGFCIDAP